MKKILMSFTIVGLLLGGVSAVMGIDHAITVKEKEGIGKYLTDTVGKTLYWYKKDLSGKSVCSGSCLERWPLYYREAVVAPEGIKAEEFGSITREDGVKQTTFRGYPLYYSINDKEPGDVNRQHGDNILWLVINPDNFPLK